jgi:hypothetical protein
MLKSSGAYPNGVKFFWILFSIWDKFVIANNIQAPCLGEPVALADPK